MCDTFCDKTFEKRLLHDRAGAKEGTWFCRGLWNYPEDTTYGGCNYWKKSAAGSLEECKNECDNSGFEGTARRTDGNPVSEVEMCKEGCEEGEGY